MNPLALQGLERLRRDLPLYATSCLSILDMEGKARQLVFNDAQVAAHVAMEEQRQRTGKVRAIILKGRKQGLSTMVGARFYHRTSMNPGIAAQVLAHVDSSSQALFRMVRRYHLGNPLAPQTSADSTKELIFSKLDSRYQVSTAGSRNIGRGDTVQLLHCCLAADTPVLMADGSLRQISSLNPGDLVRTKSGDSAPVSGISCRNGKTLTVSVARTNIPIRATAEHKFWTERGMVELKDLNVGDRVGFPVREISEEITEVRFATETSVRPQGGGRREATGPEFVPLTFSLGRVLGLYLAEGHVALQSMAPHNPSNVVFACHERELERNTGWVRELEGLFSSLSERSTAGSKTRMTVVYGRQFACFVERMCGRTKDKHLPYEWWRMPREFVRGLLLGYLAGDGHCGAADRLITAPSICPAITFGMRDVVASLGLGWAGVSKRDGAIRNGRNEKTQYALRITGSGVDEIAPMLGWTTLPRQRKYKQTEVRDGFAWLPIKSIEPGLDEPVWDIEVGHPDHDYCLVQCATSNSEFGFWGSANEQMAAIDNMVADVPGTEIIIESTANGVGNLFYDIWHSAVAGESDFIPIFVPWMWERRYEAPVPEGFTLTDEERTYQERYSTPKCPITLPKMVWRRNKISRYGTGFAWLFDQEFPAIPELAFQTGTSNPLIDPSYVAAAINSGHRDDYGPVILGVDPAGDGDDRTALVWRRGRMVLRCETYLQMDRMQVAGLLANYWQNGNENGLRPDAVVIDKGGEGSGIYSRLRELNIPAVGIMFGQAADQDDLYANKRAEMWFRMRDWLEDAPVRLPNNMALSADLCAPQGKVFESNGRRGLEKKSDMKKRGVRSPDLGDALALTFAVAVAPRHESTVTVATGHKAVGRGGY